MTNRGSRRVNAHPIPVERMGQDLAVEAEFILIVPPRELGRHDAIIDLRKGPRIDVLKVMQPEDDGRSAAPGQRHHSLGDRIATIGQQHIGPVDLEEALKKLQNRADLFRTLLYVPGRIEPDERNRHLMAAHVEDLRVTIPARRRTDLKGLVQVADKLLEADVLVEIQLGGAECLAFQAEVGQCLEQIERGDGCAVGKIKDGMGGGKKDLPTGRTTLDGSDGVSSHVAHTIQC